MESSTKKLLGVVALVYLLPVVGFLLGYFLTEGLMTENWRYVTALAAAALFFPCLTIWVQISSLK